MSENSRFREFEQMDSKALLGLWKANDKELFSEKDFSDMKKILITRGVNDSELFGSDKVPKKGKPIPENKETKIFGIKIGGFGKKSGSTKPENKPEKKKKKKKSTKQINVEQPVFENEFIIRSKIRYAMYAIAVLILASWFLPWVKFESLAGLDKYSGYSLLLNIIKWLGSGFIADAPIAHIIFAGLMILGSIAPILAIIAIIISISRKHIESSKKRDVQLLSLFPVFLWILLLVGALLGFSNITSIDGILNNAINLGSVMTALSLLSVVGLSFFILEPAKSHIIEDSTKTCPECGNETHLMDEICDRCGYDFNSVSSINLKDADSTEGMGISMNIPGKDGRPNLKICPECDTVMPGDLEKCPNCGFDMSSLGSDEGLDLFENKSAVPEVDTSNPELVRLRNEIFGTSEDEIVEISEDHIIEDDIIEDSSAKNAIIEDFSVEETTEQSILSRKKKCPYCGSEIASFSKFCRFCGRDIDVEENTEDKVNEDYGMNISPEDVEVPDEIKDMSIELDVDLLNDDTVFNIVEENNKEDYEAKESDELATGASNIGVQAETTQYSNSVEIEDDSIVLQPTEQTDIIEDNLDDFQETKEGIQDDLASSIFDGRDIFEEVNNESNIDGIVDDDFDNKTLDQSTSDTQIRNAIFDTDMSVDEDLQEQQDEDFELLEMEDIDLDNDESIFEPIEDNTEISTEETVAALLRIRKEEQTSAYCPVCKTEVEFGNEVCPNCGANIRKQPQEDMPSIFDDDDIISDDIFGLDNDIHETDDIKLGELEIEDSEHILHEQPVEPEKKSCSFCGTANSIESKFCSNCGKSFELGEVEVESQSQFEPSLTIENKSEIAPEMEPVSEPEEIDKGNLVLNAFDSNDIDSIYNLFEELVTLDFDDAKGMLKESLAIRVNKIKDDALAKIEELESSSISEEEKLLHKENIATALKFEQERIRTFYVLIKSRLMKIREGRN